MSIDAYRSVLERGIFKLEGHLREHAYMNGRYRDKYILAVYKEDWLGRETRVSKYGSPARSVGVI